MKEVLRQGADKAVEGYQYARENPAVSAAIVTGAVLIVGVVVLSVLLKTRPSALRPAYDL